MKKLNTLYQSEPGWVICGKELYFPDITHEGQTVEDILNRPGDVNFETVFDKKGKELPDAVWEPGEPHVYVIVTKKGKLHFAGPVIASKDGVATPRWAVFSWDKKVTSRLKKLVPLEKVVAFRPIDLTLGEFREIQKHIKI